MFSFYFVMNKESIMTSIGYMISLSVHPFVCPTSEVIYGVGVPTLDLRLFFHYALHKWCLYWRGSSSPF